MDVNTGNDRCPSSSKGETNFTPYKHPSEFKGNIAIESMKQLTAKIQKDIKEFIYILEDVHEKSRTTRRIGVGIAVAGLGALVMIATGGLAVPAVVGAVAAIGGAAMVGIAVLVEYINTKKNIEDVEKRWEHFVNDFLENYVYYCDSKDTARMILTHVKHVVYQEEDSYEFFRLLFRNRNPLVTEYCSSGSLYGYLEDATHRNRAARFNTSELSIIYRFLVDASHQNLYYRAVRRFNTSELDIIYRFHVEATSLNLDYIAARGFNTSELNIIYRFLEDATHLSLDYTAARGFNTSELDVIYRFLEETTHLIRALPIILFKILDLIKLALTLDRNSESASSQPLYNLAHFLDIFKDVVNNLPNYCDCSRYKVRLPLTYEKLIQMYESAIRLAEMCKSEDRAAEIYRRKKHKAELQMYEDRRRREVWLQQVYEEEILDLYNNFIALYKRYRAEILKMYKIRIEVCARCHRPLI